jgi:anti-anti-sigma regulatory factor
MDIELSGDCTVNRVEEIAGTLREALASGKPLVLHLGGVSQADLSFFQLLLALAASCRERGLALEVATGLPPEPEAKAAWVGYMACFHVDAGGECR